MNGYAERLERAKELLENAEFVLIGGGAGLSAAAGLTYGGKRFRDNFADFIERYNMTDMYSATFYPYRSQEEKWAYWARHILLNRWEPPALPPYLQLRELVAEKDSFVLTTNVDCQFYKAGFAPERIFAVQGDYGKIQCAKGCHDKLYDDETMVRQMAKQQKNCRIPSSLVPRCPVCGGEMEVNVRKDAFFVQDAAWYAAADRYERFVQRAEEGKTVLLELGVGYNTPTIIRFPFEQMTYRNRSTHLIRFNAEYADPIPENAEKTVSFREDIGTVLQDLRG